LHSRELPVAAFGIRGGHHTTRLGGPPAQDKLSSYRLCSYPCFTGGLFVGWPKLVNYQAKLSTELFHCEVRAEASLQR
jgi:hypothetical protein